MYLRRRRALCRLKRTAALLAARGAPALTGAFTAS